MSKSISKKTKFLKDKISVITFILLFFILGTGFYLRIGGVLTNSFAFTYDVGRDLMEVQKLVQFHKLPLIGQTSGLGGLYYGPWWYYILTPAYILSKGNPQGIVLFMVLTGVATIIAGYFLGLIVNGRKLGLIIATLLAFSTSLVGISSQIWNPNIAPLFVLLVFICIFSLEKNKHQILFKILLGLFLGLILDSEIVFGVLFIPGIILILLYSLGKRLFSASSLWILFGFLVILSPRILFEFRHNFVMTKSLFRVHSEDQKILDVSNFFMVLPERINTLLGQVADTFGLQTQIAMLLIVAIVIFFTVFRKKIQEKEKKLIVFTVIILCVFVVGSSVFARAVWGHYLVGLPVLYIFLVSCFILLVSRKSLFVSVILLIVFAYINIKPLNLIAAYHKPLWEGDAAVYRNQVNAVDYVYAKANGTKFKYIVYTPPVHDYTYRYLFTWYGQKKYGYTPTDKDPQYLFVILEPDYEYPIRLKNWLKIRVNDGKIVKEEKLKGGLIVQTRLLKQDEKK